MSIRQSDNGVAVLIQELAMFIYHGIENFIYLV